MKLRLPSLGSIVRAIPTIVKVVPAVLGLLRIFRKSKPVPPVVQQPAKPVNLEPQKVEEIVPVFLKELLTSSLKSLVAVIVAGLFAFLAVPAPEDPAGKLLWASLAVLIRALISALQKAMLPKPVI
jgi:hypothetical protein